MLRRKKLWSIVLLSGMVGQMLIGCDGSKVPSAPTPRKEYVKTTNGIMTFDSIEEYKDYFSNKHLIDNTGFTPLSTKINQLPVTPSEAGLASSLNDFSGSILIEILNEDAMVIIAEHLYHVDFEHEKVAVSSNLTLVSALLRKEYENPAIKVFDFADDVLFLVEHPDESEENGCMAASCGEVSVLKQAPTKIIERYEDRNTGYRYKCTAQQQFQQAGIYFSLMTQITHEKQPLDESGSMEWSPAPTFLKIAADYDFREKCQGVTQGPQVYENNAGSAVVTLRPYEGASSLAAYSIQSDFFFLQINSLKGMDKVIHAEILSAED